MSARNPSARRQDGFVLFGVVMLMAVILIIAPMLVRWLQTETGMANKEQKNLNAYNLAEAGIDRGMWMLKSSTATWASAAAGNPLVGYNFDRTYTDVAGGQYRIRFSTGPNEREVTIWSEAREMRTGQSRAIKAVFRNIAVPGPLLSRGDIVLDGNFYVHWGPIAASQGNIFLGDAADADACLAAGRAYPRKNARLAVVNRSTVTAFNRDTDGPTGVNRGAPGDWESGANVIALPRLDFDTLRSSAAASGTLNCYGRFAGYPPEMRDGSDAPYRFDPGVGGGETVNWADGTPAHRSRVVTNSLQRWRSSTTTYSYANSNWYPAAGWTSFVSAGKAGFPYTQLLCHGDYGCATSNTNCSSLPQGAQRVVEGFFFDPRSASNFVWYWDGSPTNPNDEVRIYDSGVRGTIVVRGPALFGGDDLDRLDTELRTGWGARNILVPPEAWREYAAFNDNTANQFPGDPGGAPNLPINGFYNLTTGMNIPRIDGTTDNFQVGGDLAFSGLVYVGGNMTINWAPEIYGAVWVDGQIISTTKDLAAVFFDSTLNIPVLDVVLQQQAWVETAASTRTWVAP